MTPEGKTKAKIKAILMGYGPDVYFFMPAMGPFGKSGVPDIVACIYGFFVGIEVKHDQKKNPPTALQQKNLQDITNAGGVSLVLDDYNYEALHDIIRILKEKSERQARG